MNKDRIDIIRLNWIKYPDKINFSEHIFTLKESKYQRKCWMNNVPEITDCVSSVRYLLEKSIWKTFSLWWIDEIPYLIVKEWQWAIFENIKITKLKIFDLLFVRNNKLTNKKNRIITHMWVYIWNWKIFHNSSKIPKKIITFDELFEKYNTISLNSNYEFNLNKNIS
jgi:hypothetical protein